MLVKFKTKWNNTCDLIANFYLRQNDYFTKKNEKTKYIIEKMNKFLIWSIPKTYKFISMCNYYQAPNITIFKKKIQFDYKKRNLLVASLSIATSFYYKKGFIRLYLGLSTVFCRENLNPRNFKFKLLPDENKNNIENKENSDNLEEDTSYKIPINF